jgi:hypothetical protein
MPASHSFESQFAVEKQASRAQAACLGKWGGAAATRHPPSSDVISILPTGTALHALHPLLQAHEATKPTLLARNTVKMVRVEVGGKPILDVDYMPAADAMLTEATRIRRSRGPNVRQMHFSWNNALPRLVVTSDTPGFDQDIIENWKEEGFQVAYLPYDGDKKDYQNKLQHLADPLELGEKYAIVGT